MAEQPRGTPTPGGSQRAGEKGIGMLPEVKTFSRENPCTKKDLWSCFRDAQGFRKVQTAQAHALIGINAPRVMERNGYLVRATRRGIDWFVLTAEGEFWLTRGIQSYV